MKRFLAIFLSAWMASFQAFAGCTLPASTSARPGRAQVHDYNVANYNQFSGTRDYIWDQNNGAWQSTAMPAGTFASYDIDGNRSPGRSSPYGFVLYTNAATAAGNNTLHFASVPSTGAFPFANYLIQDITHQTTVIPPVTGPLPFESLVSSSTATTVVMNQNAQGSGVSSGDEIFFSMSLKWYQVNHPAYVVYMADKLTPAWVYCYGQTAAACDGATLVPLAFWDTSVGGVESFVEAADVGYAIGSGVFNGISMDNVGVGNGWNMAGTCSIDPNGNPCPTADWTQHYTNSEYDTLTANASIGATTLSVNNGNQFINGQVAWIPNAGTSGVNSQVYRSEITGHTATTITLATPGITTAISTGNGVYASYNSDDATVVMDWKTWTGNAKTYLNGQNFCLTENIGWNSSYRSDSRALQAIPDLYYDEDGFTGDDNTNAGLTSSYTDATWLAKLQDIGTVGSNFVEETTGYGGAMGTSLKTPQSLQKITYGVASALLGSGANSYVAPWYVNASYYEDYDPDLYWNFGAWTGPGATPTFAYGQDAGGAYYRTATNGVVLVNNSSTAAITYNLMTNQYHTYDGLNWTGTIGLSPASAYIMHSGTSSKLLPAM